MEGSGARSRGILLGLGVLLLIAALLTSSFLVPEGPAEAPRPSASGSPGQAPSPPPRGPSGIGTASESPSTDGDAGATGSGDVPPPVDLDAADPERDLRGVVVDAEGRPLPGARLEAFVYAHGNPWDEGGGRSEEVIGRAVAARDGTFALRLAWGGDVNLRIQAPGYGEARLHGCQAGERVRIVLRHGPSAEVVVRDPSGKPIAGARVLLRGSVVPDRFSFSRKGATDAEGLLRLEDLRPGRAFLGAEHPEYGFTPEQEVRIPESGTLRFEVVLDPGRFIGGRVVDAATGASVPGARVGRNWVLGHPVTTDADGRFRFPGWNVVPGHSYGDLHCMAPGYAQQRRPVPAEGEVEFRLVRGDRVVGRVVGTDGAPVPGARLEVRGRAPAVGGGEEQGEEEFRQGVADEAGRFAFEDLRRDLDLRVSVEAPGHAGVTREVPRAEPGPGVVDLGDLVLPRGRRVSGTVLDSEGRPVTEHEVSLRDVGYRNPDERGRFRFTDVAPGEHGIWVVRRDAFPLLEEKVVVPEDRDLEGVVLRLPAFGRLTVRVTDHQGGPLPGVRVYATWEAKDSQDGQGDTDWVETGADGRAHFRNLKAAVMDVWSQTEKPGGREFLLPAYANDVRPVGQEITLVMEEGVEIAGTLLEADGKPAPRVWVHAKGPSRNEEGWGAETSADGTFRIVVPAAFTFDLEALRKDTKDAVTHRAERRRVTGPASDLVLRLEPVANSGAK